MNDFIQLQNDAHTFVEQATSYMAVTFILVVGFIALTIFIMFILDVTQTADAVRRNFPVIGRFRSLFTNLGEFFRQYFFAMDREEMPFNRAQRNWVDRAAANKMMTSAFGSTNNCTTRGSSIFINCAFPVMDEEADHTLYRVVGEGRAKTPYKTKSFFNISGMSFGALSAPAVKAMSHGAAMAGCWLNTGEGGLSPHHLEGGCDVVFQIGTAKYGVRTKDGQLSDDKLREVAALDQVKMFELKLAQGAKPGKGGILPAEKVTEEIAHIRGIEPHTDSISPNRHPEVNSVGELLDFINHIRDVTGKPVGFKTVFGSFGWFEDLCKEINKRGVKSAPDFITIDSGDGGTGAAPMALMDNVGLLIREALPGVVQILNEHNLKDEIKLIASGKLLMPTDVAWALCAGADFINCGRGFMFSVGCIQAMRCNKNTCPTGVTTHNERLQKGLDPQSKAVKVANYAMNMTKEVEIIAHSCGVKSPMLLKPYHVRIVQADGMSIPLSKVKVHIESQEGESIPAQH